MSDRTCAVDGCTKLARSHGLCPSHNERRRRWGSPTQDIYPRRLGPPRPCSVEGCVKPAESLRLCVMHWNRYQRTGSTDERVTQVPGAKFPHTSGYVTVYAPGHLLAHRNRVYEHRLVMFDIVGYGPHLCHHCGCHVNWRAGMEVDHLDYDRANNSPDNLVLSCHNCNTRRAHDRLRVSREQAA